MKLIDELKTIYSSVSNPNIIDDIKKCGVDNIEELILNLLNNVEPIEYLLEYHNKLGDVSISVEEREKLLNEYYVMIMKPESIDKMKNFIQLLSKLDKDTIECMMKKVDCSQIKNAYKNLIGDHIHQMVVIMNSYKEHLKDFIKWMASSGYEITNQCGIDISDIRSLYKDVCKINCDLPSKPKRKRFDYSNLIIIVIIVIIILILSKYFLKY